MTSPLHSDSESRRLNENATREKYWAFWGTYLSERQWGTVREDYSNDSNPWTYFSHDDARSRAYRWGEDGLLGISDRYGRLCFAWCFWNEHDPFLKERLFGLAGPQGNHGEDVKELYYYLDATPTHSYARALYKYSQGAFPYEELLQENARRSCSQKEYELIDTGIFSENRYFDIEVEYAKADVEDLIIQVHISNRGPEPATLHVLPTLWFRNTWAWGKIHEECTERPEIFCDPQKPLQLRASHKQMGNYLLTYEGNPEALFTENESNTEVLFKTPNEQPWVKDAFHRYLVHGEKTAVNPQKHGSKAALHYRLSLQSAETKTLTFRLKNESTPTNRLSPNEILNFRKHEADTFYSHRLSETNTPEQRSIQRQALAGLLWSKQFYNFVFKEWSEGDSTSPPPPPGHADRNADWSNLFNRNILSMPDKWEYPYYCSWDLAFHMVAMARIDPDFAQAQLSLLLREWYMHPNGQLPAYEWNFSDVNPPVHVWAVLQVYKKSILQGKPDRCFLESAFQKLLLNFTWWVNRKDIDGNNLFAGGFLGLDNIGVFDRSRPLPTGGTLKQADGTAWMAFYSVQMLSIALELAQENSVYEDLASKFFEHFVRIVNAINEFCGSGLWNEEDGFYYDMLEVDGKHEPMRIRSIVGFIPLFASVTLPVRLTENMPNFRNRLRWFLKNHPVLSKHVLEGNSALDKNHRLLAITTQDQLKRLLEKMFDEEEFLSEFGIRSVSKFHEKSPFECQVNGQTYSVDYEPAEGITRMFGGNSNWRGPIWIPINFLIVASLRTFYGHFGSDFKVEFPTRSDNWVTLKTAADNLAKRIESLFVKNADGRRPCHGDAAAYTDDPAWKNLLLFYEYFDAETGRGCGASHQTGWTSLIADLIEKDF
ncbi:MAG: MGH1-like glycoside hydrolase domain-containing protein [Chthoniobacterales bacterium]